MKQNVGGVNIGTQFVLFILSTFNLQVFGELLQFLSIKEVFDSFDTGKKICNRSPHNWKATWQRAWLCPWVQKERGWGEFWWGWRGRGRWRSSLLSACSFPGRCQEIGFQAIDHLRCYSYSSCWLLNATRKVCDRMSPVYESEEGGEGHEEGDGREGEVGKSPQFCDPTEHFDLPTTDRVDWAHERLLPCVELQNLQWRRN